MNAFMVWVKLSSVATQDGLGDRPERQGRKTLGRDDDESRNQGCHNVSRRRKRWEKRWEKRRRATEERVGGRAGREGG